jgi:hypothetical protein
MNRRILLASSIAFLSHRFMRIAEASSPERIYLDVDGMRLRMELQSADEQLRRLPYAKGIEDDLIQFLQTQLAAASMVTLVAPRSQPQQLQGLQALQILDIYCRADMTRSIATSPGAITGVISVYLHRVLEIGLDAPVSEKLAPQPMIFFTAANEQELRTAITRAAEDALMSSVLGPVTRFK